MGLPPFGADSTPKKKKAGSLSGPGPTSAIQYEAGSGFIPATLAQPSQHLALFHLLQEYFR